MICIISKYIYNQSIVTRTEGHIMAKGLDKRKNTKKQGKSLKEKRAAKRAKRK